MTAVRAVTGALLLALLSLFLPAAAHAQAPAAVPQVAKTVVTVADATRVAPITCENETACIIDYYGGTTAPNDGYLMAKRRVGGTIWVRLTLVPGMDNTNVGQVSCLTEDMCDWVFYSEPFSASNYWMAKNAGNVWVRLTKNPFTG